MIIFFFPFLGTSNAGKSTIINGIIGKDILPTDIGECTKRGIIVRYSNMYENEITIRKANFINENLSINHIYCSFKPENIIGKGEKQVIEILKSLNYEFNDKEENSFYYINTKIKLLDDLGLDSSLKRMIYFIDFPGYGTKNNFLEKEICKKVLNISNSFIFTVRNSLIKENNTKLVLDLMFNQITTQKNKLYSGFIKYCLFILNNDNSQTNSKNDLDKAKKDIKYIISGDNEINENNKEEINLCFFNAKYYSKYCSNLNYFYNLKESLDMEYKNYLKYKIDIFKHPEMHGRKIYNTFYDFYYNKQLNDKIKYEFEKNIKELKTQKIKKEIINDLKEKLQNYCNMDEILKNGDKIYQALSYCQENINSLKIFKESNYEVFKHLLSSQIYGLYNNKKEKLKKNIEELLSILDDFFNYDYFNKKQNINEIEEFTKEIIKIKVKLKDIYTNSEISINEILLKYKNIIISLLKDKNNSIEKDLNNNINIIDEIDKELTTKLKEFSKELQLFLNTIDNNYSELYKESDKIINNFTEGKIHMKAINNFKDYLLCKIGDKNQNLDELIFKDIKFKLSLYEIYSRKGILEMIKSSLSKNNMAKNNIEMIANTLLKKFLQIMRILCVHLTKYHQKWLNGIDLAFDLASIKFTEKQLVIFKEIKEYYNNIRIFIQEEKINIYNNKY